jgi:hypothetical protein
MQSVIAEPRLHWKCGESRLGITELIIEQMEAILKYEELLKKQENSKSKISAKRLSQRVEEWDKVSKEYQELKERIQKNVSELRRLLMKKIEIFENYYEKYGLEA